MLHIKRRKYLFTLIALFLAGQGFSQQKVTTINVDLNKTYQSIDNFGASDAWSVQFVGMWPDNKRNAIADLLFSSDTLKDGTPKGIGLSLWRFNLGGGSAQQGDQSGIKDEWRRAESFLTSEGTFDWNKQIGQQWFLRAAKLRGVPQFLCFANSAPFQFTGNGKTFASHGNTNLSPQKYAAFANYLAKVIPGLEHRDGVKFKYVSPVNEPQWDWSDGGQEGCPFKNEEIAGLAREISKSFVQQKVSTQIVIPEAGSIEYLYKDADKADKGNQINNFFKAGSANYVGQLPGVSSVIDAHSYFTTSPQTKAVQMREALADHIASVKGLKYWMSEYCILGDNDGEINGNKRDLGIDPALYLARVIHTDLTAANATAWQWWTAISAYNYKDGLIYVDKDKADGNFYASKMLWALGNYSRFVRPGALRVEAKSESADSSGEILISAYKRGRNFTAVIVNPNNAAVPVSLNINGGKVKLLKSYTTSSDKALTPIALHNQHQIMVDSRSITTITGELR